MIEQQTQSLATQARRAMAILILGRFIRSIRSIFVPATAIIGFSRLLTFFFVLYQPSRGPG
jgi:hypothetical protein